MSAWDSWVTVAAALIPRELRPMWTERWRADMRDAHEVGVSRIGLAFSMLSLAIVGLPGQRLFGWRLRFVIAAAIVVGAAALLMPFLLIVYLTIALFVFAISGLRRGVRELAYAAVGILIIVIAITSMVVILRADKYALEASLALAFGVLILGLMMTVVAFGRTWSARNDRSAIVWLAVCSSGLSVALGVVLALGFALGIAAARTLGPDSPAAQGSELLSILGAVTALTFVAANVIALVSLIIGVVSTRPITEPVVRA